MLSSNIISTDNISSDFFLTRVLLTLYRAFEDDNLVAVIEQTPNMSDTRAQPPSDNTSTLMMKPMCSILDEVSAHKDLPVIVETHPAQQSISEEDTNHENKISI